MDNDEWRDRNCATRYGGNGGNWFNGCHEQNMNGKYGADGDSGGNYMYWWDFNKSNHGMALKAMRWMVREVV